MAMGEWQRDLKHLSVVRRLEGGVFPMGFDAQLSKLNEVAGVTVVYKMGRWDWQGAGMGVEWCL